MKFSKNTNLYSTNQLSFLSTTIATDYNQMKEKKQMHTYINHLQNQWAITNLMEKKSMEERKKK